jgi:prefoldin subunit 5
MSLRQDGAVAVPRPKPASRRLVDAAAAERAALENDLEALAGRRLALTAELRSLEIAEREMRRRLELVDELAGSHRPPRLAAVSATEERADVTVLRGRRIREAAVRVVARSDEPLRPRHYTEWLEELVAQGYAVAGRDASAAFLTQLGRSPVVRREPAPGVYRLHFEAVAELEATLVDLNSQLAQLHHGQQTIEAITSVQQERERITRAIDRVARDLCEATAALHPG